MDYTRKIINQSNAWYNDGLRKAQQRELSGAIKSLRRSLKYHRENIAARNLLGLVYYGRGEVAEALVEWIISKNLRPQDNIANTYIEKVQRNSRKLEQINQAVKTYNQCLFYCTQGEEGMAIQELKQAVSVHPSFLKAYQLLALLYIHAGKYGKAKQVLRRAYKLDTTNEITVSYIEYLTQDTKEESGFGKRKKKRLGLAKKSAALSKVLGKVRHKLSVNIRMTNFITGLLLGMAVVGFLVIPGKESLQVARKNEQLKEHSERIHALEAQISAQTRTLNGYRAAEQGSEENTQNAAVTADSYELLMTAADAYAAGEATVEETADKLLMVSRDTLGSSGQEKYDNLASLVFPSVCVLRYADGIEVMDAGNYQMAAQLLGSVVRMDEKYNDGAALFSYAQAELGSLNYETATTYFRRVIELFPNSDYAEQAQMNLDGIAQTMQEEQSQSNQDKQDKTEKSDVQEESEKNKSEDVKDTQHTDADPDA